MQLYRASSGPVTLLDQLGRQGGKPPEHSERQGDHDGDKPRLSAHSTQASRIRTMLPAASGGDGVLTGQLAERGEPVERLPS